ncbi:organic hydroperoxide resistance protein [Microbispora rosea subsp. aerata]|nr:Ohr family peroxiredoxin [Microbispora rosea]GGO27360.1 organic hydroperoxide resistance protein [Microbispora rosea subsp. aerata]GIH57635.1 organic hydroperoxide resistance protein [Microbispora rosea subsp. aerata]GLJ86813.1 organic hydroperoxide resistance protein [Microbispora rosea subsp. aerata]
MPTLYTAEVASIGDGRNGEVRSSDGILRLPLRSPKEVGGPGEAANPELLFAAGYAACFHSALRLAARESKTTLTDDTVTARVSLNRDDSGYHLGAEIVVSLPGLDRETAEALAAAAHGRCPYSKAVRGNVQVRVGVAVS